MDKKIVKALFSEIASKDVYRKLMMGVHFDEQSCYATDTHVLVIYKESDPRFVGKTIACDGTEIPGNYPDVRRVIPAKNTNLFKGDLAQLYRALSWWVREPSHNKEDHVVIAHQTFSISVLRRFLSMPSMTSELRSSKLWLNEQGRPGTLESENFIGVIMPCSPTPDELIDDVRTDEQPVTVSYANLINTYAIESSKPKEATQSSWDWL